MSDKDKTPEENEKPEDELTLELEDDEVEAQEEPVVDASDTDGVTDAKKVDDDTAKQDTPVVAEPPVVEKTEEVVADVSDQINDDEFEDDTYFDDDGGEEIDLSDIDDDFDDDDEFYAGANNNSKGKWLNIIGVGCFLVAGLIGVWQFWLSGVDKYEEKATPAVTPVAAVPAAELMVPENNDLPVEPMVAEQASDDMADEAVLPEVTVEMSEEEITDSELSQDLAEQDVLAETDVADVAEDAVAEVEDMMETSQNTDTADEELMAEALSEAEDMEVAQVDMPLEDMSQDQAPLEDMGAEEEAPVEETPVEQTPVEEDMGAEELPEAMPPAVEEDVADAAVDTTEDDAVIAEETAETETVEDKAEVEAEEAEIVASDDDVAEAETTAMVEEDAPEATPEPEIEQEETVSAVGTVAEQDVVAQPTANGLAPIVEEEFVEETETIIPDTVEYGSLTPDQILERAVVVRPKPKNLVVVKKNSSSTSSRSILVAAERSLKQGSFADALSLYNDVLQTSPNDTAALMGKALTLHKLNHTQDAIDTYERLVEIDPNNLNAMTNYLSLLRGSDPMSAIAQLQEMESNNPKSAAIAGQLGMLYGQIKDVSNAARYFNKAQSLDPNNAVYPYNLAVISDRMGSYGKALEQYQKTLQLVLRYGGQGVVSEQVVARRIKELTTAAN